ncbi:hypothetical protein D3C81_2131370 [compost metagenome]
MNTEMSTLLKDSRKAISTAARMPERILGRTTLKKVNSLVAPRLCAASSTAKSKFSRLEAITRIIKGSIITVCPIRSPATIGSPYTTIR